jgi:hypothetical protein
LIDIITINKNEFSLSDIILNFFDFIRENILDDEIITASFILLNLEKEILSYSSFGNPPVYLKKDDAGIISCKSNNIPISKYIKTPVIDEISLNNVETIFISSDGINEASVDGNILYQNHLQNDLANSIFLKNFLRSFNDKISGIEDDITVFFIKKLSFNYYFEKNYVIKAKIKELIAISSEIESFLNKEFTDEYFINTYLTVFTELLMNSFEHGSLNIDLNQKLLKIDQYDQYISEIEKNIDKNMYIDLKLYKINDKKILQTSIRDEGEGFLTTIMKNTIFEKQISSEAGRGIFIAQQMADLLYYNLKGNEVTFHFIIN